MKNKKVNPIPQGYHTVTPYLMMYQADKFVEFIENAFNAELTYAMRGDDDTITHGTIKIGNSLIMISEANDSKKMPPINAMLYLYVDDVDAVYQRAITAKGVSAREPKNEFYGDRAACIKDAWNNTWWIATHIEDVSEEELEERKEKILSEQEAGH